VNVFAPLRCQHEPSPTPCAAQRELAPRANSGKRNGNITSTARSATKRHKTSHPHGNSARLLGSVRSVEWEAGYSQIVGAEAGKAAAACPKVVGSPGREADPARALGGKFFGPEATGLSITGWEGGRKPRRRRG
jgi:hypothetical protein